MPMRSILHRVPGIAHKFLDRVACRFRSCGPFFLQLWHGNYRVRKPVPKHLIESVGRGQYITRTVGTANFAEAKRRAPAVLAEFETIFAEAAIRSGRWSGGGWRLRLIR
jgi:hypothetical protein